MKFNLKKFVMDTLEKMRDDGYSEVQIREYSLKWYLKNVLNNDDLMEIEQWFIPEIIENDMPEDILEESQDI